MTELKVTSIGPVNGLRGSHRKDGKLNAAYIAIDKKGETICELRTYYPATVAYACLWINYNGIHATGSGSAGGYGYEKTSAAVSEAFTTAGVALNRDVNGSGNTKEAVEVLGRKLAGRKFLTVVETFA